MIWLERGEHLGSGTLGRWAIESDTRADVLLEVLDHSPALRPLRSHPRAEHVARYGSSALPLPVAAAFLGTLGEYAARLARGSRSAVLTGARAERVARCGDGSYAVTVTMDGVTRLLRAETVVYALGGSPVEVPLGERSISAATLFASAGRAAVDLLPSRSPRVAIVGGSHSAFAAATMLLRLLGPRLGPGALRI
ncbi:MAG: hypothetical protein QM619_12395 [Micropruina sp.]|uniref:hypothetical protein n=1 Tax=Micropruina sp. TaxID=2737536 RepID=UPI0039E24FDF